MLEMINAARLDADVPPVALGTNRAAQIHADAMFEHCFSGHWGLDGTSSGMRYTLAGGQQVNSENVAAYSSCGGTPPPTARIALEKAMKGFMSSPGHRKTLLDPKYRFVNIGLGWEPGRFLQLVQQFEGDYVRYTETPDIEDGVFRAAGKTVNGAVLDRFEDLQIQLFYSPRPQPLSNSQLAGIPCQDPGLMVGAILKNPPPNWVYVANGFFNLYERCPTPYGAPEDAVPPEFSEEDVLKLKEAHEGNPSHGAVWSLAHVHLVSPSRWDVGKQQFAVKGNVGKLLEDHGPGVYNVWLKAKLNGKLEIISRYSIFHEVDPPTGYGDR